MTDVKSLEIGCGERYAVCNIFQHDKFGSGSVMVWGGISLEGRKSLHVPTVPLLLLETEMKSSELLSDLTLVQWTLGSSWSRTVSDLMCSE